MAVSNEEKDLLVSRALYVKSYVCMQSTTDTTACVLPFSPREKSNRIRPTEAVCAEIH